MLFYSILFKISSDFYEHEQSQEHQEVQSANISTENI